MVPPFFMKENNQASWCYRTRCCRISEQEYYFALSCCKLKILL